MSIHAILVSPRLDPLSKTNVSGFAWTCNPKGPAFNGDSSRNRLHSPIHTVANNAGPNLLALRATSHVTVTPFTIRWRDTRLPDSFALSPLLVHAAGHALLFPDAPGKALRVEHVPFITKHPTNCRQLPVNHPPFEIVPRAQACR